MAAVIHAMEGEQRKLAHGWIRRWVPVYRKDECRLQEHNAECREQRTGGGILCITALNVDYTGRGAESWGTQLDQAECSRR